MAATDPKTLRKELHQYPENSGEETETAKRISDELQALNPDTLTTGIGKHGMTASFEGKEKGREIVIRAELDALPIHEELSIDHRSKTENVSHKCGHDGHMAIALAVAHHFSKNKPAKGKVTLLFQPAEETGQGAMWMLEDKQLKIQEDALIFALHNIPGKPLHSIHCKEAVFASASRGMVIKLQGKSSHAAEPEKGKNPAAALAKILTDIPKLTNRDDDDFQLVTPIHAQLGKEAFGTSPGDAVAMFTLRTYENNQMDQLLEKVEEIAQKHAAEYQLEAEITYKETFESTYNAPEAVKMIEQAAKNNELDYNEVSAPFLWSEDFGYFTNRYEGAMFGLGAGDDQPPLHHPDYDFPDELIESGSKMFITIIEQELC